MRFSSRGASRSFAPRVAVTAAVTSALALAGCGNGGQSQSSSDCVGPSADPVSMVRSWSQGAAFAVATIGDQTGSTRIYDPHYPADLFDVTIEQVLVNTAQADPTAVTQVANVHYTPNNECTTIPTAALESGSRVLLVLGPPDPSKDVWTVDGAPSLLTLRAGLSAEEGDLARPFLCLPRGGQLHHRLDRGGGFLSETDRRRRILPTKLEGTGPPRRLAIPKRRVSARNRRLSQVPRRSVTFGRR